MKRSILVITLLVFFASITQAQWGVEAGVGYNLQGGTFTAPCACQYTGGTGYSLKAAVSYDLISFLGLTIGLKPGADYKEFASAHDYIGGTTALHDSVNITLTYLTFDPYIRYTIPAVGIFLQVAPSFQYLATSHFYQRKYGVLSGLPSDSVWENGPLENTASTRIAAHISAGYSFGLFGVQIAPTITADLPLSKIYSSDATNATNSYWGITTIYGSIQVFF